VAWFSLILVFITSIDCTPTSTKSDLRHARPTNIFSLSYTLKDKLLSWETGRQSRDRGVPGGNLGTSVLIMYRTANHPLLGTLVTATNRPPHHILPLLHQQCPGPLKMTLELLEQRISANLCVRNH